MPLRAAQGHTASLLWKGKTQLSSMKQVLWASLDSSLTWRSPQKSSSERSLGLGRCREAQLGGAGVQAVDEDLMEAPGSDHNMHVYARLPPAWGFLRACIQISSDLAL